MTNRTPPAYLRLPTISGSTLVFVSDDDLWRVDAGGGVARRLGNGLSEPSTPCLSRDGEWIAYAGRDEQHSEVWLMPSGGGAARRLTWLGSELAVRGWTADGRILFCGNHGQPFLRNWHAYTIAPDGGQPERLPLGQVNHLSHGPQGRIAIGRNTADPARWKRYRGGTAGHLWVEDVDAEGRGSGRYTRLEGLQGNLTCPMWIGSRLYFIGDGEGIGNLYSCDADGSALRRHSDHADHYARHASSDGRRIVYQCGAEIWIHDPALERTQRVEIEVAGARTQAARRYVAAADHLQGATLHPAGHSVALEVRGQLHTMAFWEGAPRQHGDGAGRRRLGSWLGDGATLVCVSDAGGEEAIEVHRDGAAHRLPWSAAEVGRVIALAAAPRGARIAFTNHRNELWLGDVDDGSLRRLDRSDCARITDLAWSPCAGWLAYGYATSPRHTAIKLCEVSSGTSALATAPEFRDYAPAFDPEGKYLYFLSLRTFDPVYDSVQFELSFPRAARPYLVALRSGGAAPFEAVPRGVGEARDAERRGGDDATPNPLRVDLDGLARRVAAFPVPEGRYAQIAGVAGAKVVWTALPIAGAHGRGGHKEGPGRVECWDFASGEVKALPHAADRIVLAADGRTLLLQAGAQLRVVDATKAVDDKAAAPADEAKPSRRNGRIDLARLRIAVDPPQEWAQMLAEVWRLQRDQFWVADMSGVDWDAMRERYARLLPRVATRGELSDLIWELQGELGTSHAYEMGGDHRKPPAVALGHLAAELRPAAAGGWVIDSIVQGDTWDAAADSPLNAVGVEAQVGERIVAVGGLPVGAERPPQALLVQRAGAKVALTLARDDGSRREVLITALADEAPARYRAWVEGNRAWVHTASGGRVGYLHLPDMMSAGFAEFHRCFAAEADRDGLVVDLRYNRGGHVSQLLLEKVARRRIGWNVQRWGQPSPYPEEAPAGAVVALTNEHAGSDGDIFSHCFKLMRIGTLVGQRTWGGVIGIWPRHRLIDGTETTQPEYSFWFQDVGWAVENHGTEPQIAVANAPHDDAFNAPERDRQLAAALGEALAAIERAGAVRPDFGPRPRLAPPPLPPR